MFVDDVDDLSCSSTEVPQLERRSLSRSVEEVARDRKLTSKMPIQWRWPGIRGESSSDSLIWAIRKERTMVSQVLAANEIIL
jgi:hypothetical protein